MVLLSCCFCFTASSRRVSSTFALAFRLGNGNWTNANAGSLGTQQTNRAMVVMEAMDEYGPLRLMMCDDLWWSMMICDGKRWPFETNGDFPWITRWRVCSVDFGSNSPSCLACSNVQWTNFLIWWNQIMPFVFKKFDLKKRLYIYINIYGLIDLIYPHGLECFVFLQ